MTNPAAQILADEVRKRVAAIAAKEAELKTREEAMQDRERRVAYREDNVSRRERIIYGKPNH